MIIKLIGSMCVLVGFMGIGHLIDRIACGKLKELEDLRKLIILLKSEILYHQSPLFEAFERLSYTEDEKLGEMFHHVADRIKKQEGKHFFEIWKDEIKAADLLLSEKDKQELTAFGEYLGILDLKQQERTIALYLEQLKTSIDEKRNNRKEQKKLTIMLSAMAGLFLIILFG